MTRRWSVALACAIAGCGGDDAGLGEGASTSTGVAASSGGAIDSTGVGASSSSGVADTTATSTDDGTGATPMGYDDPALWLCHPGKPRADDACLSADLRATAIAPDGSTELVEHTVAADPAFDCFYVYPTVDIRFTPGQTEDFADISQELDPLLSQAARLTSMCRVFAPLYHQVTLGTFGSAMADELLDAAYQDVRAAFESYLAGHADGRPLVILGHSQGTFMTTRLVQEFVEPDAALRERLLVALLVGGSVSVPPGELVGGTFTQLPLCSADDELGCVVAYRSYAADHPPSAGNQAPDIDGNDVACTNPAALGSDALASARGALLPTFTHQPVVFPVLPFEIEVDTPFVLLRDYYRLQCQHDGDGFGFLAVDVDPADPRANPVDFSAALFSPGLLGLHVLDYNLAQQDLLDLVAAKAAAAGL